MKSVTSKGKKMSEAATSEPSGNEPKDVTPPVIDKVSEDPAPNPNPVDKDKERVLKDVLRYKAEVKELQDKLSAQEISGLKSKEDWKKIAEIKEEEAKVAKEELGGVRSALASDKKLSAIRNAAVSAGMKAEALDDLDLYEFEDVVLETTSTGRINVLNAQDAIDRFKMTRPHLFGGKKTNINSDSPGVVNGGEVTYDAVIKAQKKAEGSGDYAPYEKILRQFQNRHK